MTQWEFSHIPFEGDLADDKIVCQKCGGSWKVKDGGNDLFVCHSCGFDNSNYYLSNFEGIDPDTAKALGQGAVAIGSTVSSAFKSKESKELAKSNTEKEIEARCGKKRGGKKKKQEYNNCKNNYLASLEKSQRYEYEAKQKQLDFQRKAYTQSQKNQKITTFVVVGIFALILGFAVYKKYNK